MASQIDLQLLDLAFKNRLLTRKQADMVREELNNNPAETAANQILRRHYVTEEQLSDLLHQLGVDDSAEQTFRGVMPDPQTAPAGRQLSVGSLPRRAEPSSEPVDPAVHAPTPTPVTAPEPQPPPAAIPRTLVGLLRLARHWGCSDLHISVGRPPYVRLHGQIRYMETDPLTPEQAEAINFSGLTEEQQKVARDRMQIDFALEIPKVGRHRCSVFHQRTGWDGVYRLVPAEVPTLEQLGLPGSLRIFTEYTQGLVMVTGPGGSGKTSTVAAMLDVVNANRTDHIITVEDPIEYLLEPKQCQVTQREVGRHTNSFAAALRAALREDPDIIFIGELRDLETTSIAISAAETGHLVFSTLHTGSAMRTVARIVDVYPVTQQAQVCTMVAESLRGVICQQLIPRRDGNGRAMALEVLVNTTGVSQQIKEGKTHMLTSLIQAGKKSGMMLMEDSLLRLHTEGLISGREAYRRATNKQPFERIKDDE